MTTNTIHLHRVLKTPPEKVYRAFLDTAAMMAFTPRRGTPSPARCA